MSSGVPAFPNVSYLLDKLNDKSHQERIARREYINTFLETMETVKYTFNIHSVPTPLDSKDIKDLGMAGYILSRVDFDRQPYDPCTQHSGACYHVKLDIPK